MRLAATAFVLVAMVSMAVSASLRNTVDVTIIRSEQDELEATVEWENGRMGMRIEAKQNKLLIRSMAADEEIFIYGEKKDSGTFYTAGGQSFFTMETEQNDGTVTKMDYVIPDSMKEQAKEAFEQKKMDRILSTLDHENAQQYTEQTIQSLIHRPEVTVLEQAARVLGEGGLIGRNNKGALLFYMTILNMVKSQDREVNQHGYVAKREVKFTCVQVYVDIDFLFIKIRVCIRVCTVCSDRICRDVTAGIESISLIDVTLSESNTMTQPTQTPKLTHTPTPSPPATPCAQVYVDIDFLLIKVRVCIRVCRNVTAGIESTEIFSPNTTSLIDVTLSESNTMTQPTQTPKPTHTPTPSPPPTQTPKPTHTPTPSPTPCPSNDFESAYTLDYLPYSSDRCAIPVPEHLHSCRKNNTWWLLCEDCYHGYECERWFCPIEDPCPPGEICDPECIGMCGQLCSCWPWLCGDCCYWLGCYQHDRSCESYLSFSCILPFNFDCNGY